ncbi:hypothetical protein GCM10017687_04430 [Streptomyces echinatus]
MVRRAGRPGVEVRWGIRFLRRVGDALEAKGRTVTADMCGAAMMTARRAVSATMATRRGR